MSGAGLAKEKQAPRLHVVPGRQAVIVDAAGKPGTVELHVVVAGVHLPVDKTGDLPAEEVVHGELSTGQPRIFSILRSGTSHMTATST